MPCAAPRACPCAPSATPPAARRAAGGRPARAPAGRCARALVPAPAQRRAGALLAAVAALACMLLAATGPSPVRAQEIQVGLSAAVTSMDPHFHNLSPNNNVMEHLYDTLVAKDGQYRLRPGLAESWRSVDELTWEFRLRRGVRFHDGSEFTAADVVATLNRAPNVPKSPSSFGIYTRQIAEVKVIDSHTLRVRTRSPYPLLPNDLSTIYVIPARFERASTDDFNSGRAAVGTGPWRLVRWQADDRIELARNDAYWGGKAPWERAVLRIIPRDPTRVAALLAGEVRAIENVPTADLARLATHREVVLHRTTSNRFIYLHMDSARDRSPFVADAAGRPLERNPLRDARVRRAMSMAINRQAIAERVMDGAAVPTGQLLPAGLFGYVPGLRAPAPDPEGARKLLAEAGYPDGFSVVLHTPNDRYVNDEQVAQAVAGMLSRAGIRTRVEAMPSAVFFSRGNNLEFSLLLAGWAAATGEASSSLRSLLATFDKARGMGVSNRGRYSNPKVDQLTDKGLGTLDDAAREKLFQAATEVAMADMGVIPLYHQVAVWATRRGIGFSPRTDEATWAHELRPAP
jgi:peptide/nickel transport system substrate-binding protein